MITGSQADSKTPEPRPGRQGGRTVWSDARMKCEGSLKFSEVKMELSSGGRNQSVSDYRKRPMVISESWRWI